MKKNKLIIFLSALLLFSLGLSFSAQAKTEESSFYSTNSKQIVVNKNITLKAFDGTDYFLNKLTEEWKKLRIEEFDGSIPTQDSIDLRLTQEEMSHLPMLTDERKTFIKTLKYQIQAFSPDLLINASKNLYLIVYNGSVVGLVRYVKDVQAGEEADWLDRLYVQPSFLAKVQPAVLKHFSTSYAYILTGVSGLTDEFQGYIDAGWVIRTKIIVNKKYKNFELPAVIIDGPKR